MQSARLLSFVIVAGPLPRECKRHRELRARALDLPKPDSGWFPALSSPRACCCALLIADGVLLHVRGPRNTGRGALLVRCAPRSRAPCARLASVLARASQPNVQRPGGSEALSCVPSATRTATAGAALDPKLPGPSTVPAEATCAGQLWVCGRFDQLFDLTQDPRRAVQGARATRASPPAVEEESP